MSGTGLQIKGRRRFMTTVLSLHVCGELAPLLDFACAPVLGVKQSGRNIKGVKLWMSVFFQ